MNLNYNNNKYLIGFMAATLIVVIAVTIIEPTNIKQKDTTDYAQLQAKAEFEKKEYEQLLKDVHPDYASSEEYLKKIVTVDEVRGELERDLQTKRKIAIPTIADSEVKISDRKDTDAVANYLTDLSSMIVNFDESVNPLIPQIFATQANQESAVQAKKFADTFIANMKGMTVPVDAVPLHKTTLVSFESYSQIFEVARKYAVDQDSTPWADLYQHYVIIDSSMAKNKSLILDLTKKYVLRDMMVGVASSSILFKTAQAGFPVIDIYQVAETVFKHLLVTAFSQYYLKITDKTLKSIEKGFTISSQLYYSNTLGRSYSVEFFKKFLPDPLDQEIVSQFLPQYFCKPKDEEFLKKVFIAKAKANSAPNFTLNPADPEFLNKTANFLSDPKNYVSYYRDFYQAASDLTKSEAEISSAKEVSSDGLKSGRAQSKDSDIVGVTVQKSMSTLRAAQQNIFDNVIKLGTGNPDNMASQIVGSVMATIINDFVFTPAGGGDLQVYKETQKCLQIPKIQPIVPITDPGIDKPSHPGSPTPYPSGTAPFK